MRSRADAERLVGELQCDCDADATVKLYEDGDLQDDGSILWLGFASGECPACDQSYADWWEGTFKIGAPQQEQQVPWHMDHMGESATRPKG